MARPQNSEDFWATIRQQADLAPGECVTYTAEELASFAEGRMRPAQARVLEAHVAACEACRELVDDLKASVEATQTVYRLAPARALQWRWSWALAPVALAAAALVVVLVVGHPPTPRTPVAPIPAPPRVVVQAPTAPGPVTPAPVTPGASSPAPSPPPTAGAPETPAAAASHRAHRGHRSPRRPTVETPAAPEVTPPGMTGLLNPLPSVLSLSAEDAEALYDVEVVLPADAMPELLSDLRGKPAAAAPDAALFASPVNSVPDVAPSAGSPAVSLEEMAP